MYAFPESARVIATVREAAKGFATLGAELDVLHQTWEDFYPGLGGTMHLFAGNGARVEKDLWNMAIDLRDRNWQLFRAVFADHDLIVSPTAQILAPKIEDWASYLEWHRPGTVPPQRLRCRTTPATPTCLTGLASRPSTFPPDLSMACRSGLQLVGWPGSEATIFRAAHAFLDAYPRDEDRPLPERPIPEPALATGTTTSPADAVA